MPNKSGKKKTVDVDQNHHTLSEELLYAWVGMTALFKNTRLTTDLTYNESTVLLYVWQRQKEGGLITVRELLEKTKMQKSLLGRTLDMLETKHLIERKRSEEDARVVTVAFRQEEAERFLMVHERSLDILDWVISIIGEEDAESFVRIYNKISKAHRPEGLREPLKSTKLSKDGKE